MSGKFEILESQGNVRELFISGNVREMPGNFFFGWLITSKTTRKSDKTM